MIRLYLMIFVYGNFACVAWQELRLCGSCIKPHHAFTCTSERGSRFVSDAVIPQTSKRAYLLTLLILQGIICFSVTIFTKPPVLFDECLNLFVMLRTYITKLDLLWISFHSSLSRIYFPLQPIFILITWAALARVSPFSNSTPFFRVPESRLLRKS